MPSAQYGLRGLNASEVDILAYLAGCQGVQLRLKRELEAKLRLTGAWIPHSAASMLVQG